jgi:protein gp37
MTLNKTGIDWCDCSDNPVSGCYGPDGTALNPRYCRDCYALKIASRFNGTKAWPHGFKPTIHPERLGDFIKEKRPRTIFVCSMADLFGDWVPDLWINDIMKACDAAPWHTYIFLTKNPARYKRLPLCYFKNNRWFGTSVSYRSDIHRIMTLQTLPKSVNTFISFEPLLANFTKENLSGISQIIIGAQTNPTIKPELRWIIDLEESARDYGIRVFCKESLFYIPRGYFLRELAWPIHKEV